MPTILAIETSSELASCALLHGELVSSRDSSGVRTHSQSILPMVQSLLDEAGIRLSDCDAIAYGCGPGSFTGVRTACGVAQGLAFGAALPAVPVVTLDAMAHACRQQYQADEIVAVLDARMGEVYWAQYRYADGWHAVVAPTLCAPHGVHPRETSPHGKRLHACGNGFAAYEAAFSGQDFARGAHAGIMPHAIQIGQLARIAFAAGMAVPAARAQPLYLRNKIAFTSAERHDMQEAKAAAGAVL